MYCVFAWVIGHHIFATDSKSDLDGWVDAINSGISEDRRKQKKRSKTKVAEEAEKLSSETSTSTTGSRSSIHPSTLMGNILQLILPVYFIYFSLF